MILILDLDNTILHSRAVALNFSLSEYYKPEIHKDKDEEFKRRLSKVKEFDNLEDYFEVCRHRKIKYLVRKRPHLHKFLETISEFFTIFVYTFGTRDYALEIIENIDPEEKILKKARLISKTDAPLSYKELAKIIPGAHHDITMILDDNINVWHRYKNNLL